MTSAHQTRQRRAGTRRDVAKRTALMGELYGTRRRAYLPADWRERLPDAEVYFRQHLEHVGRPNASGWASACCPFHEDAAPSLSVNVTSERGLWRCFGCGLHGDIVTFHEHVTGLSFADAVRDLIGLSP